MKAAASSTPALSVATISGLAQPMPLARISAQTRPSAPPVTPAASMRRRPSRSPSAAPVFRAHGMIVLTLEGERISAITRFVDNSNLPRFGLPRMLGD
jgi:hypothetical protein